MKKLILFAVGAVVLVLAGLVFVSLNSRVETVQRENGRMERYYFLGELVGERAFKGEQPHGITKTFYGDGSIKNEFRFEEGKKHGTARHYSPEGNVQFIEEYREGKKINRREYDERGNLVSEKNFE